MSESKAVDRARSMSVALGLCLLVPGLPALAQSQVQPSGNQPRPTATGPSSPTDSSAIAGAQQNLYTASGQNGAQSSQDSFKGSVVEGTSTGTVMDLSLDDAIQRGLRANLGLILQDSAQSSANGQRLEQLQALLPTATGAASINVQQVNLAAYGLKFPGVEPDRRAVSGGGLSWVSDAEPVQCVGAAELYCCET